MGETIIADNGAVLSIDENGEMTEVQAPPKKDEWETTDIEEPWETADVSEPPKPSNVLDMPKNNKKKSELEIRWAPDTPIWKIYSLKKVKDPENGDFLLPIPKKHYENMEVLLDFLKLKIEFDIILRKIYVNGQLKDLNNVKTFVKSEAHKYNWTISKDDNSDFINIIAHTNKKNVMKDYVLQCHNMFNQKSDGFTSHIEELAMTLITDEDVISEKLKFEIIKTWLVTGVHLWFNSLENQHHAEGFIVLQGKQRLGKTSWVRNLLPTDLKKYIKTEQQLDVEKNDSLFETTSYAITEIAELDGVTRRKLHGALKSFITSVMEEMRRPFQRDPIMFPRHTLFFGSVNDSDYLTDKTGNRRFWTIPVLGFNWAALEKIDINMLWGEVVEVYLNEKNANGRPYYEMSDFMLDGVNRLNGEFTQQDEMDVLLEKCYDWSAPKDKWGTVYAKDIMDYCGIRRSRGLKSSLENLGAVQKRGKKGVTYLMPPQSHVITI